MTKRTVDSIFNKVEALLKMEEEYYVNINKVNSSITITPLSDDNSFEHAEWSESGNSIKYGPYTFSKAVAFGKLFNDLYHVEYKENFNIKTTKFFDNNLKAF